jgi:hypothetical protein
MKYEIDIITRRHTLHRLPDPRYDRMTNSRSTAMVTFLLLR